MVIVTKPTFDWVNGGKTLRLFGAVKIVWVSLGTTWLEHLTLNLKSGGFEHHLSKKASFATGYWR